jgi:type II secretory pathway predicted ATPase ExeA
VLGTPHYAQAKRLLIQATAANLGRNSGHSGVVISRGSTLGKTTLCKRLMLEVHRDYYRQNAGIQNNNVVPVAYIEVPAASNGKNLMRAFTDFFGMTVNRAETMVGLRNRVVDMLNTVGTHLVVIDELHNLARNTQGNGESHDVLKNLHNDVPATFLYAGIDVQNMLAGPRGQQIGGRFALLELHRYNLSRMDDKKMWQVLVNQFEASLLLRHHEKGTLVAMSDYLFERTNGSIGSLGRLLTGAAMDAITDPNIEVERIDHDLLEAQTLDLAAENARQAYLTRKNNPRSAKNLLKGLAA